MKSIFTRITPFIGAAITLLCLTPLSFAQDEGDEGGPQSTSVSDNPYLRKGADRVQQKGRQQAQVPAEAKNLNDMDRSFMTKAAEAGKKEIELSDQARRKGGAEAKRIGDMLYNDHATANNELMALAKSKKFGIDTSKIKVEKIGGKNLDQAYISTMVSMHQEDVKLFQEEISKGKDADVKAWAKKKLPILQKHLNMVKSAKP